MKRTILFFFVLSALVLSYGVGMAESSPSSTVQWSKSFGGQESDVAYSLIQTGDGGFALAGSNNSNGSGGSDALLIKTDSSGNMQWERTYGGSKDDIASALLQTADGGYVFAGMTESYGAGGFDYWLVKID